MKLLLVIVFFALGAVIAGTAKATGQTPVEFFEVGAQQAESTAHQIGEWLGLGGAS